MELTREVLDSIDHARVFSFLSFLVPLDAQPNVVAGFRVVNQLSHIAYRAILGAKMYSLA